MADDIQHGHDGFDDGEGWRDDGRPGDGFAIEDPDGYAVSMAAGELTVITNGARLLKGVSALAAGLWILALIANFWSWYELNRDYGVSFTYSGPQSSNSVVQALGSTLTSTWGYLLVAVLAYVGSMVLHGQRMRLLVMAADAEG